MGKQLKNKIIPAAGEQETIHPLDREIRWMEKLLSSRLSTDVPQDIPPLAELDADASEYAAFIREHQLTDEQRIILLTGLIPHIRPDFFDRQVAMQLERPGDLPQLGGVRGKNYRGFLPTGETVLFLLAGNDLPRRFEIQRLLQTGEFFQRNDILWIEEAPQGEPAMSGRLIIGREYVERFSTGIISKPTFGVNFPAQQIETGMEWSDLVLPADTMRQIHELEIWLAHHRRLMVDWQMARKLTPGYRVLFHGPPGTGKTLTASLLGKHTGLDVYRVDLSMVISKYIGETEKNLSSLFDQADNKNWILFFDEADALFGKRTNVRDAHDKYANQEVSFLLQRTENYHGLVILATNFKSNIDDAFARRFQSHIYFPPPKYEERLQLWKNAFPEQVDLSKDIDLSGLARNYQLTGANIMNITQFACLKALDRQSVSIFKDDLDQAIRSEFAKEGKVI